MPHRHHAHHAHSKQAKIHHFFKVLMRSHITRTFIFILILLNAAIMGMETSPRITREYGDIMHQADDIILGIFTLEILFRIIGLGAKQFFRERWCIFDFIVVVSSLLAPGSEFAIFRTVRVLRVLRLISAIPALRKVINGLIASLTGVFAVASILSVIFYIFAVLATHLYANFSDEYFGSVGRSMFTLFQIMTLASWSEIVRAVMVGHPNAWMFFITFILVSTFTMLNLLIGVMVNTMENVSHIEEESYQGVDRRKKNKSPPDDIERRRPVHVNATSVLLTEVRLHATEQKLMSEIHDLRQQMKDLYDVLGKIADSKNKA